jgi:hypothetical protein
VLIEWLIDGLGEWCESCLLELYDHGHRYQDEMLTVIDELYQDLGNEVEELHAVKAPNFCEDSTVQECIATLQGSPIHDLDSSIALFHKKAKLVNEVNGQLDEIEALPIKVYSTCRACSPQRMITISPQTNNGKAKPHAATEISSGWRPPLVWINMNLQSVLLGPGYRRLLRDITSLQVVFAFLRRPYSRPSSLPMQGERCAA